MDLGREVDHALEAGQRLLPFVVMIAERDAQLVSQRPFLDPADEQVDLLLLHERRQLDRVGVINQDRPRVADLSKLVVIVAAASL